MNVNEAINLLDNISIPQRIEKVSWQNSMTRILAEDIVADHDFPPFNRVMMDGFAFRYNDWLNGKRSFKIQGFIGAGDNPEHLTPGECIEIMTGASLPHCFDCVIPNEKIILGDDEICIPEDHVPILNHHVHIKGTDYQKGTVLIAKGTQITALHIAVITSCGYSEVSVYQLPKIAIVSTGDELVAIDETPLPYQIRMSNGHALQMLLQSYSREISVFHWKDNFDEMSLHMDDLHEFDILVFTGGVSKGKKDYMPQIWENAGFTKRIHGIQQKPGKPIWVGHNENQILFGLPGNPVSALTCAIVYVLPWIRKNIGQSIAAERIEIIAPYPTNEKLDLLLPVVYTHDHWEILKNNGSGDLIGFSNAQGIVRVPKKSQENDAQILFDYFPAR